MEFLCNVLVVADQLLISRLKEMCEVAITEKCEYHFFFLNDWFRYIRYRVKEYNARNNEEANHE